MAVRVKELDAGHDHELDVYDEYIEQMEEECCALQVRTEKMEAYIDDLKEQNEELSSENRTLKSEVSKLKKRKADEVVGLKEVDNGLGSKRLRTDNAGGENKENRDNVTTRKGTTRRSSCIFGIGVQAQKEAKKNKEMQSKEKPMFTSAGVLSNNAKQPMERQHQSPQFGGSFD